MRIISDFHDYYDPIQSAGQDLTLLYHRKQREERIERCPFPMMPHRWSWHQLRATDMIIGFCGKLYPLIRVVNYASPALECCYCYTPEDVQRWVDNNLHKKEVAAYGERIRKRYRWKNTASSTRDGIETFFAEVHADRDKHEAMFTQFNAPIFLADSSRGSVVHGLRQIEINPCLRTIEFYRAVDPYTAFQELAMYLGKQARPEKPIPAIPDKVMAGAKGFNDRSFRKDPGKKRRGRK